jgi:nucleoside-diphosphate-sugar epimerase
LKNTIVLFGSHGRLGSALYSRLLKTNYDRLYPIHWSNLSPFAGSPFEVFRAEFRKLMADIETSGDVVFVFANGLTDPRLPGSEILFSNLEFPRRVIEATSDLSCARYLTIGTIQEQWPSACQSNPYLQSKFELSRFVMDWANQPDQKRRILHCRLHTLYGGEPKDHMFLGQIVNAIRSNSVFSMSSGEQLREYHHVDDIAESLANIMNSDWSLWSPILEINSGQPLKLLDLAMAIFNAYKKQDLLQVGKLFQPQGENTTKIFTRSSREVLPVSREPVEGVLHWMRDILFN